jgi:phosphoglycerol transferase
MTSKVAIIQSWPNLPRSAEREFAARLKIAGAEIGVEVAELVTSDEILEYKPDIIIPTHEYTPKLTSYLTLGALWSPPSFFENDPIRQRSILSYDAYLAGSESVRLFIDDLYAPVPAQKKPVSDFLFVPSSPEVNLSQESGRKRCLVYCGVHWDGLRHGELFYRLSSSNLISIYGPQNSWGYVKSSYRGEISFGGLNVIRTISEAGISLCLHKKAHRQADTPSMRLFEAAAAQNLIISDTIGFAQREFKDTIFYIDTDNSTYEEQANQIQEIVAWAQSNPTAADQMARASHEIFVQKWALQKLLPKVINFADEVTTIGARFRKTYSTKLKEATLDVIIRVGSRPIYFIERAINSVVNQKDIRARALVVQFAHVDGIDELCSKYGDRVHLIMSTPTGYRSSALWDGLNNISADYFAVLDDDDTVDDSHWSVLADSLSHKQSKGAMFAYSGVIKIEEDGGYVTATNFAGPSNLVIRETRELRFMDFFNQARLLVFDNYIQSNAWIAKKEILELVDMTDPMLEVAEDMYLYILFLSASNFAFVPRASAYWHWRSLGVDNSMNSVSQERWMLAQARLKRRLRHVSLINSSSFGDLHYQSNQIHSRSTASADQPNLICGNGQPVNWKAFDSINDKEGVHPSDSNGVWTNGHFAWFTCFTTEPPKRLEVELCLTSPPSSRDLHESQIKIWINESEVFASIFGPMDSCSVQFSYDNLSSTSQFIFALTTDRVYDKDSCDDPRRLGIRISALKVSWNEACSSTTNDSVQANLPMSLTLEIGKVLTSHLEGNVRCAKETLSCIQAAIADSSNQLTPTTAQLQMISKLFALVNKRQQV